MSYLNRNIDYRCGRVAVIPCFNADLLVLQGILKKLVDEVERIIVVDDACPNNIGNVIDAAYSSDQIIVLWNSCNSGVGGATKRGFEYALNHLDCKIVIKLDCDGQMEPRYVKELVDSLIDGEVDMVKANRFFELEQIIKMPKVRLIGNLVLSFFSKASTGYWELFDPNNGFFAITTDALRRLPLHKISNDYFFESDLLFRSAMAQLIIKEVYIPPIYNGAPSALSPVREIPRFFKRHVVNTFKRCFYQYFLFDFNPGSLEILISFVFTLFSIVWSSLLVAKGYYTGLNATSGDVSLFVLSSIIAFQSFMAFINYDTSQRLLFRSLHRGSSRSVSCSQVKRYE